MSDVESLERSRLTVQSARDLVGLNIHSGWVAVLALPASPLHINPKAPDPKILTTLEKAHFFQWPAFGIRF